MTMETSVVPRSEGLRPSMIRHGTSYCAEDTWPWRPTNVMCSIRSVQLFFVFLIKAYMFWAGKTTHRSLRTLHGDFSLPQTQVVKLLRYFRDVACSLFLWGKKK